MSESTPDSDTNVVRLTMRWLVLAVTVMIGLGIVGGILAMQIWPPQSAPLMLGQDPLVSTIQEVTISPNTSVQEVLSRVDRSVLHLVDDRRVVLGTGWVVTNDGLVVSAGSAIKGQVVAIDNEGRRLAIDILGQDNRYGLTYLRLVDAVISPLDVRSQDLPVGWDTLVISRSVHSNDSRVESFHLSEYVLPAELSPPAWQRIMRGNILGDATLYGAPLLDDEGSVSGIIINPGAGLALPVQHLKESLARLAQGQRESDPLGENGLKLKYRFVALGDEPARFIAEIRTVAAQGRAAEAGLRTGDMILTIGDDDVSGESSVAASLLNDEPLRLIVRRGERIIEITY